MVRGIVPLAGACWEDCIGTLTYSTLCDVSMQKLCAWPAALWAAGTFQGCCCCVLVPAVRQLGLVASKQLDGGCMSRFGMRGGVG